MHDSVPGWARLFEVGRLRPGLVAPTVATRVVPANDVAHFIRDLVRGELDLTAILSSYEDGRGFLSADVPPGCSAIGSAPMAPVSVSGSRQGACGRCADVPSVDPASS